MKHQWFALYTRSRHEKRVEQLLGKQQVEVYLPMVFTWRRWSDRMKRVEVPLFNSYIFVRTHPTDQHHYYNILQTPGVVRFITFEGTPVALPDQQIDMLKRLTNEGFDIEPIEKPLSPGTPIEIKQGALKGIRGEVLRVGGKHLLIIQIDSLDKCIQVTLPAGYVEEI